MAEINDQRGLLIQNLEDAGCDKELTQKCLGLAKNENLSELLKILSAYKQQLLSVVHVKQKEVDCLDYLIYSIKKNESQMRNMRRNNNE